MPKSKQQYDLHNVKAQTQQTVEMRDGFDDRRMTEVAGGTDKHCVVHVAVLTCPNTTAHSPIRSRC